MSERIFLSPPHLMGDELEAVRRAFESNYIAPVGPDIDAFEREMEAYLGGGHCVAVSSGTAAIHLALILSGVGPGDRVLCSDFTFVASVNPVLYQGANPVLVDSDPATWNMDADLAVSWLQQADPPAKAVVAADIYGIPADLAPLAAACEATGAALIEDAAEALGSRYRGRPAGLAGRFGVLSFNGNKIITGSSGGMLICRDAEDAVHAKRLATQARDPAPHYQHSEVGYNYRLSNICAAIGRAQLRTLEERVTRKRDIFTKYRERLQESLSVDFMPQPDYAFTNCWLTCLVFHPQLHPEAGHDAREAVRIALEQQNIESRPLWKPMHLQPLFSGARFIGGDVGADLFKRGLCLPSGTALHEKSIDRICDIVRRTIRA